MPQMNSHLMLHPDDHDRFKEIQQNNQPGLPLVRTYSDGGEFAYSCGSGRLKSRGRKLVECATMCENTMMLNKSARGGGAGCNSKGAVKTDRLFTARLPGRRHPM